MNKISDIISLAVVQKALESITKEMAIVLRNTAFSPNIKERLDFSCALFDHKADIIASKDGIPVHLGSMDLAIKAGLESFQGQLFHGDVLVHNSPYRGGTHLPDITLFSPLIPDNITDSPPLYYIACRAHHADVGGKTPGSMPGHSESLYEEGIQIPPVKLWERGELNSDVFNLLLENMRSPRERKGDLFAQRAAITIGVTRLQGLVKQYSYNRLQNIIEILAKRTQTLIEQQIETIPSDRSFTAIDYLDSDGSQKQDNPIPIKVTITRKKDPTRLIIDFSGSSRQREANVNATKGITRSCVFYVLRYLLSSLGDIPTNFGLFQPVSLILPKDSIVNASHPYATSSGNVETSQRIVDVLFKALSPIQSLDVPAASQGTMNNVLIGDQTFVYYETLGGGTGGTATCDGVSAIHSHMTNTLNTPVEVIETNYPLRIKKYEIRTGSGGVGKHKGGNGLVREYEILCKTATVSLQTERRKSRPYGLFGGKDGSLGKNILLKKNGEEIVLPARTMFEIKKGDILRIITPGGGGYGSAIDYKG